MLCTTQGKGGHTLESSWEQACCTAKCSYVLGALCCWRACKVKVCTMAGGSPGGSSTPAALPSDCTMLQTFSKSLGTCMMQPYLPDVVYVLRPCEGIRGAEHAWETPLLGVALFICHACPTMHCPENMCEGSGASCMCSQVHDILEIFRCCSILFACHARHIMQCHSSLLLRMP